ncbi:MAG: AbrB/MazE/SpoVT family DNA-binding domain-containing protein [Dermatophilaceae bacterium]
MSGTYTVTMGDRGRLVLPAQVRERLSLDAGTTLLLLESPRGLVLASRDQVAEMVRDQLSGHDLVGELLTERRAAAARGE